MTIFLKKEGVDIDCKNIYCLQEGKSFEENLFKEIVSQYFCLKVNFRLINH
jgi:hypothetical protein